MRKEIRGIITVLNLTVSALVTELLMRWLFNGVGWWRV